MGLDWNPGGKAKPGHEDEVFRIVRTVSAENLDPRDRAPVQESAKPSFLSRLYSRNPQQTKEQLLARFNEITIAAFETLNAPRVGHDPAAEEWARATYTAASPGKPLDEWLRELNGYYVVALVPPCDGLPAYSHGPMGYVELYSFRAEFLKGCKDVIGPELLDAAYTIKFPQTFLRYGKDLSERAAAFAERHGVAIPDQAPHDTESLEGRLHIAAAAGRWCRFWADRGHMLDPYW